MRPIGVRLPDDDMAVGMKDRFNAMDEKQTRQLNDLLGKQPRMREFLQQAIKTLNGPNSKDAHTQIAHFLMGRPAKLPEELSEWVRSNENCKPAPELASMLDDLLRTSRYGFVQESAEKTLAKLEYLATGMEKIAVAYAFNEGRENSIPSSEVGKWMYGEKSNSWLSDSKLGARNKEAYQPQKSWGDLKTINGLNQLKNIHVHIGKITDFKADNNTKAAILLRSKPNLLLGEGHAASQAVMHADGPGVQAGLFQLHGLPLPSSDHQKNNVPPGLNTDDNGNFTLTQPANDMKDSHSIDAIGIFGSTHYQDPGKANAAAEKLGNEFIDKTHLILPMQDFTLDPYNAVALAQQNPARHIILVIDQSDGFFSPQDAAVSVIKTLRLEDKKAANPPDNLLNLA